MILIAKPKPILQGSDRVIRSGSWFSSDRNCRSAYRTGSVPMLRDNLLGNLLGFRIILRKRG